MKAKLSDMQHMAPSAARRTTFLIAAVVLVHMIARHPIYRAMPVQDWDAWFSRDSVMSVPRLLGFAAGGIALLLPTMTEASLKDEDE